MTGLTPVPFVVFQSCTAPAMLPWSVSVTAAISSSAARATRSGIRQAPSRIEYSEWTWRWTNGAAAIGGTVYGGPLTAPARAQATSVELRRCERQTRPRRLLERQFRPRPLRQVGREPKDDRLDDDAAPAVPLDVLEADVGIADSCLPRTLEGRPRGLFEPFVPEDRRHLPRLAPGVRDFAVVERERDEAEARVADPRRADVEVERGRERLGPRPRHSRQFRTASFVHASDGSREGVTCLCRMCAESVTSRAGRRDASRPTAGSTCSPYVPQHPVAAGARR